MMMLELAGPTAFPFVLHSSQVLSMLMVQLASLRAVWAEILLFQKIARRHNEDAGCAVAEAE